MNITNEQQLKKDTKIELINDLMSVVTIMEDYWIFHPENEKKLSIVKEYARLKAMKASIEDDLGKLK